MSDYSINVYSKWALCVHTFRILIPDRVLTAVSQNQTVGDTQFVSNIAVTHEAQVIPGNVHGQDQHALSHPWRCS